MQTIQIEVAYDKLDTFLTIVENLQKDLTKIHKTEVKKIFSKIEVISPIASYN